MKRLLLIGLLACFAVGAARADTAVPPLVNYQGLLTDENGVPIPDGMKKLEFNLYDAPLAGNRVWGPQVFDNVPVVNGRFNVILGTTDAGGRSIAGAFTASQRFLGFKVGAAGADLAVVAEISPRQQLLSAPYAIHAQVADVVRGPGIYTSEDNEKIGIGTSEPDEKLTVNGVINAQGGIRFPDGTVKVSARLPPPDFESPWFRMESQAGNDSFKEIAHNLGVYPRQVRVLVKAVDGPNSGFIFEGTGSAQSDDDGSEREYGGVVFAYNATKVRLWAPDENNNNYSRGTIINVTDGWGGAINNQRSHSADVMVQAWR